jgi:hypothetical protein
VTSKSVAYFPQEALTKLRHERGSLVAKYAKLTNRYLTHQFRTPLAKEHAHQGFLRRCKTLVRCVQNVFQVLPPDLDSIPSSEAVSDATINIQAFIFNTFGAIENIAWIWVSEQGLKKPNGAPLPEVFVGLRKRNTFVRESFSTEFKKYLSSLDAWFENLDNFRHALAHRIPLYIPPFVISPDHEQRYREIDKLMWEALLRMDFEGHRRLESEQQSLGFFRPWMTHSVSEKSKHVVFHAQILADFNTIEELSENFLLDLTRSAAPSSGATP